MKTYEMLNNKMHKEDANKKRVFIFTTKDQYKQLLDLKYKYRLSFSYIIRLIASQISLLKPLNDMAMGKPLYKTTKWRKTSVKVPKTDFEEGQYNAKYYNNAIIIWLDRLDKELLDPKIYQKFRNQTNNYMSTVIDPLWQYNEYYRMQYLQKKFEQ